MPGLEDLENAFTTLLGDPTGLYVLGLVVVLVLVLAIGLALGRDSGSTPLVAGSAGIVAVVLFGWWPVWTVLFVALIVALVLVRPLGESRGGGAGG